MSILCTTSQLNQDALNLVQALAKGKLSQPERRKVFSQNTSKQEVSEHKESGVASKTPVKGTRFTLPTKKGLNALGDSNAPVPSPSNVATLNVLGMQPDFSEVDNRSLFTVDQTVVSSDVKGGSMPVGMLRGTKTASADDIKRLHNKYGNSIPSALPKHIIMEGECNGAMNATSTSSVGTQSLIANESIPDALPSADVSNITVMLELGSITTVESLGKSIGLTSNNSKNLDISVSNLVSPGLIPNRVINSKDDLITSESLGLSQSNKPHNEAESGQEASRYTTVNTKHTTDKKAVEVNWESLDRVRLFDHQYSSTQNPIEHTPEDEHTLPIQPQHVRVVVATAQDQEERPDSRITHFTHSTAPLAGGANMLGSQVHPSTVLRHSTFSSEVSTKDQTHGGFETWPSEVALTYTLYMASVSIFGRTSSIQKTALQGSSSNSTKIGIKNYGLLDLAEYKSEEAVKEDGKYKYQLILPLLSLMTDFFDWSVRHGAVLGLSRVSKACRSLPMKDGLSDLAWWKLVERHKAECDIKVLQAFSIAQVQL